MSLTISKAKIWKKCEYCKKTLPVLVHQRTGEKFQRHGKKYCDTVCRDDHKGNTKKATFRLQCGVCEDWFDAKHSRMKYCDEPCRKEANRLQTIEYGKKHKGKSNYFWILERDDFTCQYCGYKQGSDDETRKLHLDHIHPSSKDGEDIASNLITSCQRCNNMKTDKLLSDDNQEYYTSLAKKKNQKRNIADNTIIKQ